MRLIAPVIGVLLALAPGLATAQEYPTKPIDLVIPYPPGSSTTDIVGRKVAELLGAELDQSVVVENRGGANGSIGTSHVARAKPDGYTLLVGVNGPMAVGPSVQKLDYDPVKDFEPIGMAAISPYLMVVPESSKFNTLKDVIDYAKAHPGELKYASTGVGSGPHLSGAMFGKMAGIEVKHVPYTGSGQVMNDLVADRVQMYFTGITSVKGLIDGKQLKPIAMASLKRSPAMPDMPTLDESGLPGFDTGSWVSIMAPAGTPKPVVDRLVAAFQKVTGTDDFKKFVLANGAEPSDMTPDQLRQYIADSVKRYHDLVESIGGLKP